MKKIFFAVAILYAMTANAKIWRINYNDDTQADFKTIAACQAWKDFTDGDTLYIEPGMHRGSGADNTITKSCVILGPGWGFQSSTNKVLESEAAIIPNLIMGKTDSGGRFEVFISGLYINGNISVTEGTNYCKKLVIERCYFNYFNSAIENLIIKNCYINSGLSIFSLFAQVTTATITGNIILGIITFSEPLISIVADHNTLVYKSSGSRFIDRMSSKVVFSNNIVISSYEYGKFNGIDYFLNPLYTMYNNVISFSSSTIEDAEYKGDHTYDAIKNSTNKLDATIENTFKCNLGNGYVDPAIYYQVKDDAVAKTADSKGGECGAFGGDNPYQLYGRPNGIPYLYDINVPSHTTDNQLKISFKVAGNNE